MINKDLGMVTAYAYAVSKGYAGTEEQFATLMASYADVGQTAVDAALAAKASEDAAKASETASAASQAAAATSAGTASTAAQNASESATTASGKATEATTAATAAAGSATTAGNKATEAAQSATAAAASATAAESAKTAAQTAQTAAEAAQTAAETAQSAAEDAAESVRATLIVNEASGAIATFTDGSDGVPMESVTVQMEPIQDLHGQDAPYPGGGGKNLCPQTAEIGTAWNGASNTASARITLPCEPNTQYTLSVNGTNNLDLIVFGFSATLPASGINTANIPQTFITASDSRYITLGFNKADIAQSDIDALKLQLEKGSTATTYAPYANICPISGRSEVGVWRSGVNVWDEEWEVGAISTSTGQNTSSSTRIRSKNYVPVDPDKSYLFVNTGYNAEILFYDKYKTFISKRSPDMPTSGGLLNQPSNCYFVRFSMYSVYGNTYNNDISINCPSTDTEYHPHDIQTITIPLGQTVYGGTVDAVSGVMTVDRAMVTYDGSDDENWETGTGRFVITIDDIRNINARNEIIANIGYYSASSATDGVGAMFAFAKKIYYYAPTSITTATEFREWLSSNNLSVVYYLSTPLTIQLSAQQLTTLLCTNNVWSDGGDVDVDYVADTKLFIEQLTEPDANMVADANITSGAYFMVGNQLFLATANIASGAAIVPGVNCTRTNLAEALNALNA